MAVELTDNVKAYMRIVAGMHIDGDDEDDTKSQAKDELWDRMGEKERDGANELVLAIFEPWL